MEHNCGYIASKPGILKLLTVVFDLASLICIVTGFVELKTNGYFRKKELDFNCPVSALNLLSLVANGPTENVCVSIYENECSLRDDLKPCPVQWLINLAIIIICFLYSGVLFVVLLLVELNKNGPLNQIDMICHILAGVFQIIGAVLILAFVIISLNYGSQLCKDAKKESIFLNGILHLIDSLRDLGLLSSKPTSSKLTPTQLVTPVNNPIFSFTDLKSCKT